MQLIIKNGKVIATHSDHQVVAHLYPDAECVSWSDPLPEVFDENGMPIWPDDPRTEAQKVANYADKRRVAYPSIEEQLDMIYWDQVNGTNTWREEIVRIKSLYEKV